MKTANVNNVVIQMDIPSSIPKEKEQEYVLGIIDTMNEIIRMSELEAQPQILSSGIDSADIDTNELTETEE